MKLIIFVALIIVTIVEINGFTNNYQVFSQCDQTVGTGVATCLQYFSPIQFVTDFLDGNKDSLCCTHFRHNACIQGVRDAAQLAKSANLCPDSISDDLISTLTHSTINSYIKKSCKSFNAGKCVMDSVGDVVQTIQGFFTPIQQNTAKPVIPQQVIQSIPQLFNTNSGQNIYTSDIPYGGHRNRNRNPNHNYNNNNRNQNSYNYNTDSSFEMNPFREIFKTSPVVRKETAREPAVAARPTENPLINKSILNLYDRQYIPEASDVNPTKEVLDNKTNTQNITGYTTEVFNTKQETPDEDNVDYSSVFESIGSLFGSPVQSNDNKTNEGSNMSPFFSNFFNFNETGDQTIVKDITDTIN